MKSQNPVLYILRISVTLLLIAGIMAAALAFVNSVTAPLIAKHKEEKTQQAIEKVLPGGGTETEFTDTTGLVRRVYASETGYAVEVTPAGFDGAITMMVGVDKQGNVQGISVISHTETAGLGAVAAADTAVGQSFRDQFKGMNGSVDIADVDTLTGATITSKAVIAGINAALACVEAMG